MKKTLKQLLGFLIVGFFGTLINGVVFSVANQIPFLQIVLMPWFFLSEASLAWGIGVIAGFVFNFILDKRLVFKA